MMAEMVRARKPLAILELPIGRFGGIDQMRRSLYAPAVPWRRPASWRLVAAGAPRIHLLDATRDFRAFHQMLFDAGLAVRAGEPLEPPTGAVPDDLPIVVARINGLIDARTRADARSGAG